MNEDTDQSGGAARRLRTLAARIYHAGRILVVCYGNICRSPYAARVLERALGTGAGVSQGGFYGPAVRPGRGDGGRQAARLRPSLGFPAPEILVLGDLDPAPNAGRAIPDPYGSSEAVFAATYARIDRCIEALVAALRQFHSIHPS